jgi:predicted phosphodiesterase
MALEKDSPMFYALGMERISESMGIMGDSHGSNGLLAGAIGTLRASGARTLIHLGDMCDTLAPHLMDETFRILEENGVRGVRGNNECQMVHDLHSAREESRLKKIASFLERLPYVMNLGPFWFTHSVPYSFPAATRRPVSEFLPAILEDPDIPFSILFRGHSHRPSILGVSGRTVEKIPFEINKDIPLERGLRYIITVGAVEKASCVLFQPAGCIIRFIAMPRI